MEDFATKFQLRPRQKKQGAFYQGDSGHKHRKPESKNN